MNVTQFYRGERFVEGDVIYEIVGERRVSRFENRVMLVLSYLLALAGGVLLASKRFFNR